MVNAPDDFESTYKIMNLSTVYVLTSATVSHTCGCSTIRGDRISSLGQLDAHTLFALPHRAFWQADDVDLGQPAGHEHLDIDGLHIEALERNCFDMSDHARAIAPFACDRDA